MKLAVDGCTFGTARRGLGGAEAVTEIVSVEYWRDLEIWVRVSLRSLKMTPIDRSYTTLL